MKICVIGAGIIGSIWGKHYHEAGQLYALWNRTPKPELPCFHQDLIKASQNADMLHIVLSEPQVVQKTLQTLQPILAEKKPLLVQSSTISPKWSEENELFVTSQGARYVEAPFTGSKTVAEKKGVVFFIGGPAQSKQEAIEELKLISSHIFDLGSCTHASAIKLAMNLNISGIGQALNESLSLARSFGIDDKMFFNVLSRNASRSGVSDMKQEKLMSGDFSPHFSTKHMLK